MRFSLFLALAFLCGLEVGRAFPSHHYTTLGSTPYVLDTATGVVCTPFRVPPTPDQAAYWSTKPQTAPVTVPSPATLPVCSR